MLQKAQELCSAYQENEQGKDNFKFNRYTIKQLQFEKIISPYNLTFVQYQDIDHGTLVFW